VPTLSYLSMLRSFLPSRTPTYLVFAVTSRCNADCRICFYWERLNRPSNELSLSEIKKISESFGYVSNLVISGGEPFLRDDLDKICLLFYKNNGTRFFNIPTNGILSEKIELITKNILRLCKKATISLELSLDGIGKTHDQIRGASGLFDHVMETYRRLKQAKQSYNNLWLKVNTTFCYHNQDEMNEIYNYVSNVMDVDDHSISLIWGMPKDPQAKKIDLDRYVNFIAMFEKNKRLKRKSILDRIIFIVRQLVNREVIKVAQERRLSSPCTAIRKIVFINEEGKVYPCGLITEEIGDLREQELDINKVLCSLKRYEIQKKYGILSTCACNWDCALFNNVIYNWRNYPRIVRNLLEGSK